MFSGANSQGLTLPADERLLAVNLWAERREWERLLSGPLCWATLRRFCYPSTRCLGSASLCALCLPHKRVLTSEFAA